VGNEDAMVMRNDEVEFDHAATEIGGLAESLYGVLRIIGPGPAMGLNLEWHDDVGVRLMSRANACQNLHRSESLPEFG